MHPEDLVGFRKKMVISFVLKVEADILRETPDKQQTFAKKN